MRYTPSRISRRAKSSNGIFQKLARILEFRSECVHGITMTFEDERHKKEQCLRKHYYEYRGKSVRHPPALTTTFSKSSTVPSDDPSSRTRSSLERVESINLHTPRHHNHLSFSSTEFYSSYSTTDTTMALCANT